MVISRSACPLWFALCATAMWNHRVSAGMNSRHRTGVAQEDRSRPRALFRVGILGPGSDSNRSMPASRGKSRDSKLTRGCNLLLATCDKVHAQFEGAGFENGRLQRVVPRSQTESTQQVHTAAAQPGFGLPRYSAHAGVGVDLQWIMSRHCRSGQSLRGVGRAACLGDFSLDPSKSGEF